MRAWRLGPPTALAALLAVGCGTGSGVADPFTHGLSGGTVIGHWVICDPTPNLCNRYVVVQPSAGTTQARLAGAAEQVLERRLGWTRSQARSGPAAQSVAFNGQASQDGAYVNTDRNELAQDRGYLDQGASALTGRKVLAALRAHPHAVVIRLIHDG